MINQNDTSKHILVKNAKMGYQTSECYLWN